MADLMNSMLKLARSQVRDLEQFNTVWVVLGNETCDLDSAISSLVYSLLLHQRAAPRDLVVPVLNIPTVQLPVKTEVVYLLNKFNIGLANIICRDDLDLTSLQQAGKLQLTLVDHHVLPPVDSHLRSSVVTVIDHRPQDPAWLWPQADLSLRIVGSCCTLVADKLLTQTPHLISPAIALMLLGTILLDTANLSESAGRATALDHQIVDQLTTRCGSASVDQSQFFSELQRVKSDVSSLSTSQLLIKDMKVASGIPIVGLPMKVEKFLQRQDVIQAIQKFCKENQTDLCILYGMDSQDGVLTRDLAVYSEVVEKRNKVTSILRNSQDPFLDLQSKPCSVSEVEIFEQKNIKHSRKQILPIVRKMDQLDCNK